MKVALWVVFTLEVILSLALLIGFKELLQVEELPCLSIIGNFLPKVRAQLFDYQKGAAVCEAEQLRDFPEPIFIQKLG